MWSTQRQRSWLLQQAAHPMCRKGGKERDQCHEVDGAPTFLCAPIVSPCHLTVTSGFVEMNTVIGLMP